MYDCEKVLFSGDMEKNIIRVYHRNIFIVDLDNEEQLVMGRIQESSN